MGNGHREQHPARVGPRAGPGLKAQSSILGPGVFLLMVLWGASAQAQCTSIGITAPLPAAVPSAVAGVSASVGSLISSIHTANTGFLTQSSAFIGSPFDPQPEQLGGGFWARGVGGHMTSTSAATAGNIMFGGAVGGNISCNTRTVEDFSGVQLGADVARLNVNGWNLHAGSTVGYMGLGTHDATPPGLNPPPSFRDDLQVPFIGIYGAATKGGFFVDGQVRWDFYQNQVSDSNNGLFGQHFDARGIGLTGNIGYNQDIGHHWFIEPSAGIIWSRTQVDALNVPGTIVTGSGFVPPWVLNVNDVQSTLGRLGVRMGTSVATDNVLVQPFASASVYHEFQGGATASLTTDFASIGAPLPTLSSSVSTSSLGTYGQFGGGVAAQFVTTGWVSYLRTDYRIGDNIEGWSLNGGLRYQFVPEHALGGRRAMIAKAPIHKAPARQAPYDWSGLYIGAYAGADWGGTNWSFVDAGTTNPRFAGFLGGGEVGYNYQLGKWVFGVEGDIGGTNAHGARRCPNGFFFDCEIEQSWLSTAAARVGYAYWDRLLLYMKGGVVIARDQASFVCNTGSQNTIVPLAGCPSQSNSKTAAGWVLGWGSEFGLTRNVSVRSETAYFNLGSDSYNMTGILADIQRDGFISTVGLRFRFGGGTESAEAVTRNQ